MTDNVLERLNDWHIDIVKHDVDWGRLVIDAKDEIERLRTERDIWRDSASQVMKMYQQQRDF